jgi:RecA-family ATPase
MIENNKVNISPFLSLKEAIDKTSHTPTMKFTWWGIPRSPSVTLVAARAKAGKTILAENLAIALVDVDCNEFLGLDIATVEKVAIISFEEALINRTQRQAKQIEAYNHASKTKAPLDENIFVLDAHYYQLLVDDKQRNELLMSLKELNPDVIIIDSLGRLGMGQIEDSSFAQQLMLYLRHMAFTLNCPVIALHHTVKAKKNESVELSSMAVYSGQTEPPIPVETEPLCFVI